MNNVVHLHRVDVVNDCSTEYVMSFDPKIASVVSCDDMVSNLTPFSGVVELLIQVSIESESGKANRALEGQIPKAFFEGIDSLEFRVCSIHQSLQDHGLRKTAWLRGPACRALQPAEQMQVLRP